MTKEQLDRIKKAYSSGLKVQIWFNGYWEDFDIRDYSMCSDPFSENRQYRIVGSDYADIAEKSITKLENKVEVMGRQIDELKGIIALKNQNAAEYKKTSIYRGWSTLCYKDKYDTCLRENTGLKIHNAYVEKKLDEAKEPKWHDLRKDPDDLPPNEHEVYVAAINETARGKEFVYGFDRYLTNDKCWFVDSALEPIAWCEIPKYTEE